MLNIDEHPRIVKARKATPPNPFEMVLETADGIERVRMQKWLAEHINRPDPHAEIVTLTPVLARLLLERNNENRNVSALNLERMKRDVLNGMFAFNGEPIIIAVSGELNDGQHRCMVVSETGKSIQTVIVFGAPRESRLTVNQGIVRTAGNYVSMQGFGDPNNVASVASCIWIYRKHNTVHVGGYHSPTKAEILDVVDHYRDIADSLNAISSRAKSNVYGSRSLLAFAHWVFSRASSKAKADEFFDRFFSGANLDEGSPILYCRNRLLELRGNSNRNNRMEMLIKCWNAWRRGRTMTHVKLMGGKLPEVLK